MRKIWLLSLTLISLGISLLLSWRFLPPSISVAPTTTKTIRYEQRTLPHSVAQILLIPADSQFLVTPAISEKVETVEEFARKHRAKAIANAGFFDPANQKSTSYVIISSQVVADPKENDRLVNNPNLKPYLSQILNRTEFRRYQCGQTNRYDIVLHNESTPAGCQLIDSIGAGPSLLPELTLVPEGFVDESNGRDALGSKQPNARTAIGITPDGGIAIVMVAQKPSTTATGISLPALADLMKTLGVNKAMNLDGGSSSSLDYNGKTFYGKVNLVGKPIKRPVKSFLLVQEN
jgi:exopolysaccharide biosynthesis protein